MTASPHAGRCRAVIGYGGGSAIDVAKAVAVLAPSRADPLDHLEVIGDGRPITVPGLPCVAIPTTAGTGSEVTRNAVLSGDGVKASLRSHADAAASWRSSTLIFWRACRRPRSPPAAWTHWLR